MAADRPKQYLPLLGRPMFQRTLLRLCELQEFAGIVVAIAASDNLASSLVPQDSRIVLIQGGAERCHSVLNALDSLSGRANPDDWVLVHDVARPCVRIDDIQKMLLELADHPVGGVLGAPVRDTMKRTDSTGVVTATEQRQGLWHAFTPQMFRYELLLSALRRTVAQGILVTDESAAVEGVGLRPRMVTGAQDNLKVTYPEDVRLAELILQSQGVFE